MMNGSNLKIDYSNFKKCGVENKFGDKMKENKMLVSVILVFLLTTSTLPNQDFNSIEFGNENSISSSSSTGNNSLDFRNYSFISEAEHYDIHVDDFFVHVVYINDSNMYYARNTHYNSSWSFELIHSEIDGRHPEIQSSPNNSSEIHIFYRNRSIDWGFDLVHVTNSPILNVEISLMNHSQHRNNDSLWTHTTILQSGVDHFDFEFNQEGGLNIAVEYGEFLHDESELRLLRNFEIKFPDSNISNELISDSSIRTIYFDYEIENGFDYFMWGGTNEPQIMFLNGSNNTPVSTGFSSQDGFGDLEVYHESNRSIISYFELSDGAMYLVEINETSNQHTRSQFDYCQDKQCSMSYLDDYEFEIDKNGNQFLMYWGEIEACITEIYGNNCFKIFTASQDFSENSWKHEILMPDRNTIDFELEVGVSEQGEAFALYSQNQEIRLMTNVENYSNPSTKILQVTHEHSTLSNETNLENLSLFLESEGRNPLRDIKIDASSHACAIKSNHSLYCWGYNYNGQLGDGTINSQDHRTMRENPTHITNNLTEGVKSVSTGGGFTCVITILEQIKCWGNNKYLQLGNNLGTSVPMATYPVNFSSSAKPIAVDTGSEFACALLGDNTVNCWGRGDSGQLGDGNSSSSSLHPMVAKQVKYNGLPLNATSIGVGNEHACASIQNGSLVCWGENSEGRLGDGTEQDSNVPINVGDFGANDSIRKISLGAQHSCVLTEKGHIYCWGWNDLGTLGIGSNDQQGPLVPTKLSSFNESNPAMDLSSGGMHVCALLLNNSVVCWGEGMDGQLGDTEEQNRISPTIVNNLDNSSEIISLATGDRFSCAMYDNGNLSCWGRNINGRLGIQGDTIYATPIQSNISDINNQTKPAAEFNSIISKYPNLTNCSVIPSLPNGLLLDSNDCSITGNPIDAQTRTHYLLQGRTNTTIFHSIFSIAVIIDEVIDTDNDGIQDSQDDCPDVYGNSTSDRIGCPDSDGDGWSDLNDDFPDDASEYRDTDGDQVGDNSDAFPNNSSEWQDTDGDGVGDNTDDFPNNASETTDSDGDGYGDNSDQFPFNSLEHTDSDGDGIGDNSDEFPHIDNNVNSDSDNYSDVYDAFPLDSTQWEDSDGDGYGDNLDGNSPDVFSNLSTQWSDFDQDGFGDNWGNASWNESRYSFWPGIFVEGAEYPDYCPTVSGNSSLQGVFGCEDSDGDGLADFLQEQIVEDNEDENNTIDDANQTDSDNDGVIDTMDLCNGTSPILSVDENGCPLDFDGDGVFDEYDKCPFSSQNALVNEEGCQEESPQASSFFEALRSGEQSAVVRTIGFTSLLIAILGFLQTNAVASALPESLKWIRVLNRNYRLTKEEEFELSHLMSLVITYHEDSESLKEELFNLKAEISSRFANKEISKKTKEVLFSYIDDILLMNKEQIKKVALSETFYGLRGATKKEKRLDELSNSIILNADESSELMSQTFEPSEENIQDSIRISEEDNSPPYALIGVMHESGYEVLEYPEGSGAWWWKNDLDKVWQIWE